MFQHLGDNLDLLKFAQQTSRRIRLERVVVSGGRNWRRKFFDNVGGKGGAPLFWRGGNGLVRTLSENFRSWVPGWHRHMSASGVRRDKAALSSGCEAHPATAPAGSSRSSHGGNELAEAFG